MPGWLYRYEAKSIQEFVLGSSRLREIAGASALVESLSERTARRVGALGASARMIVNAAGGATIVFNTQDALAAFASSWLLSCARWCPGLTVVQAWAPFEGDAPDAATMAALQRKLVASRATPMIDLPEVTPASLRAGRTGEAALEDRGAQRGRDGGCFGKSAIAKDAAADDPVLDRRFDAGVGATVRFLRDLDRFGEGYLAVIHADGNGVGQIIQNDVANRGLAGWRDFSEALRSATERAAQIAYEDLRRRREAARRSGVGPIELPFRPVVLGGDDLTVITRAADAVAFTSRFLTAFEDETRARSVLNGGNPLTACAGIALVKPGFPFHAASQLAGSLCDLAKEKLQPNQGRASSLAFHRVTTASVRSWDEIVSQELAGGGLVGGPWFIGAHHDRAFNQLCSLTRHAADRDVARGAMREWLTLARTDRAAADVHWRRMIEVLHTSTHGRHVAREFGETLARLGATDNGWRADGTTPVADALAWLSVSAKSEIVGERGGTP